MTTIASGFNPSKPISCAQGRYGELIITQGGGVQPKRWTGTGTATNAGIAAPTAAPAITLNTAKRYYVARADVHKPGAVYYASPAVTFSTPATSPAGFRAAKAQSYLNQSIVSELRMTDGGKHYPDPPTITLGDSHGKGAVLTAVLDGTPPAADSITHYAVTQGPPFDDEAEYPVTTRTQYRIWGAVDIPITNGSGTITRSALLYHNACGQGPNNMGSYYPIYQSLPYTVSGATGTGAVARVNFYGQRLVDTQCLTETSTSIINFALSCFVRSVTVTSAGSGYDVDDPVTITIPAYITLDTTAGVMTTTVPSTKNIIIKGYPPGHGSNTSTPRFAIKEIQITNAGSGYVVAPEIKITSNSGFGAYATCGVAGGKITSISLESGGGGYKLAPTVTAVSGGAEAFAVARPHLRGKYQCYYRYVDNTPPNLGGPIPSSLSPVAEVDAGDGAQSMTWSAAAPTSPAGRPLTVELWRTTGDQALMLYRVGTGASFVDDLTDDEVRDPDRAGYAAMPIVLPNGDLNAMRFTPPPNNKAVVVRFQDRFWYGVDTGGTEPNSIYFSEVDEPESVPDINEFVLQQNARDSDAITAMIPFGSVMLVMQSRHAYAVTFAKQPLRDAEVAPVANRGCFGQRCWDIHEGLCYVLDQHGLYAISPQGEFKDLSAPIGDMFRTRIDCTNTTWNFVLVDAVQRVVRSFVAFKEDSSSGYPTRALCYGIDSKTWWIERYPHRISAGAVTPMASGENRCVYGAAGGAYLLGDGSVDAARGSIVTVTVTNKGAGYRTPPTVRATGGVGGELQASIGGDGKVTGIRILNTGYGYTSGSLTISSPDDPTCLTPVQATATFTATAAGSDTALYPVYRIRTGNYQYPNDHTAETGGVGAPRDISLTYRPHAASCPVALRLYYNNASHPRPNVAPRNRGVGFASGTVDAASTLDMGGMTTKTGYDTGVAKGVFAGRTIDDMQSADRHVSVELIGAAKSSQPVAFYELDVYGTAVGGE